MTNAEAIETLRANYPDACFGQLREAVDMAIKSLESQDWIPCSDASTLPKDRTFWVTHMNGYEAWVGELYWDMTEWSDCISDVVAYMPCNIPEPYREGEG